MGSSKEIQATFQTKLQYFHRMAWYEREKSAEKYFRGVEDGDTRTGVTDEQVQYREGGRNKNSKI